MLVELTVSDLSLTESELDRLSGGSWAGSDFNIIGVVERQPDEQGCLDVNLGPLGTCSLHKSKIKLMKLDTTI